MSKGSKPTAIQFISAYLQMRIDFSELENDHTPLSNQKPQFFNTVPAMWKNSNNKQEKVVSIHEDSNESSLSFSVNYPYEVNRSVSPSAIKKQLAYLQAKKILPASTLRFIQSTLQSQMQKSSSIESNSKRQEQNASSPPKKSYFESYLNPSQQSLLSANKNNKKLNKVDQNYDKNLRFKKKSKNKWEDRIKPRVYDIKVNRGNNQKDKIKEDLKEVTLKPILNYTMNSQAAKVAEKKRKDHFKNCRTNIFQTLYRDASLYVTKREMERVILQEQGKSSSRKSSRVKINSTFEERLKTSIEKQALRKKLAQNKLDYDPATGRKMFVPDISLSKRSYSNHSRSHHHLVSLEIVTYPARAAHYSKDSSKLNHSLELATTLNNSFEKTITESIDSKYKIQRKPLPRQNKLAEIYANLVCGQSSTRTDLLNANEKRVLSHFLQQINKYEHKYSKGVSKQVFTAFFKETYITLNLFDKGVLDLRLKEGKKSGKNIVQPSQKEKKKESKQLQRRRINQSIKLNHSHKYFFI